MKPKNGMVVILSIFTTTAALIASMECPPGTPRDQAQKVVEQLAMRAHNLPKGTLNMRYAFDEGAGREERLMWQELVLEHFFASHGRRILIDVPSLKKSEKEEWIDTNDLKSLKQLLKRAVVSDINVAIYIMPKAGEYRIAVA